MSALTRIANSNHRHITIEKGDTIIISATPIPGNEKPVSKVVDELIEKGANVIYKSIEDIHVSGHARQEELKLVQSLLKPKYFVPVHGEDKHLIMHGKIAEEMGVKKENIFILENGNVLTLTRRFSRVTEKVPVGNILIDGLGIGDVGNIVIKDRKHLSQDGIVNIIIVMDKESKQIISGPDVVTRGFVYVRESEHILNDIKDISSKTMEKCIDNKIYQWSQIKSEIRNEVNYLIYHKTKRRPMIVPIIVEI